MSQWQESQKCKLLRGTPYACSYPLFITVLHHINMVLRSKLNYDRPELLENVFMLNSKVYYGNEILPESLRWKMITKFFVPTDRRKFRVCRFQPAGVGVEVEVAQDLPCLVLVARGAKPTFDAHRRRNPVRQWRPLSRQSNLSLLDRLTSASACARSTQKTMETQTVLFVQSASGNSFFHVLIGDTVLSIEYRDTVVVFRSESMKTESNGGGYLGAWGYVTPPRRKQQKNKI